MPSPLPRSTETSLSTWISDGQVEAAVAVEVARHDGIWTQCPDRVRDLRAGTCRRRCPAAPRLPMAVWSLGDGQVELAVAGEVPCHDDVGLSYRPRTLPAGWKVPSPLPSSTETCLLEPAVGDGQVEWPSPVKSPATMEHWAIDPTA